MEPFSENTLVDLSAQGLHGVMTWMNPWYWAIMAAMFFAACTLSLAPWKLDPDHNFLGLLLHSLRRISVWTGLVLIFGLLVVYFFYDLTYRGRVPDFAARFWGWVGRSALAYSWLVLGSAGMGAFLRVWYFRFVHPYWSGLMREWRNTQTDDKQSDIRDERGRYKKKDFDPSKFYSKDGSQIFMGLDLNGDPIYVPASTWLEVNMQIIGPTRFGKGVLAGAIMDQVIRRGDALFYIDPKEDKWAPHVMLQACMASNRKFVMLNLRTGNVGRWSPFEGGDRRDAYSRLTQIFGMTEGGNESDFYKSQEKKLFNRIIKPTDTFSIEAIYHKIKQHNERSKNKEDKASRLESQLEQWRQIAALNPPKGTAGFSVADALMEGSVVYIWGSLTDETVKVATKAIIMEIVQECNRLKRERTKHLTLIVDEVKFLVSKVLTDALATVVGADVNIVLLYQSVMDLRTPDDATLDGEAVLQSINVNSQLKAIYGAQDPETAEWAALMSGTIMKQVTAMEHTTVRTALAEEWDRGRTIKQQEENLIHSNVFLALPPRVCIIYQIGHAATVAHTAPVAVKDMKPLEAFIASRERELLQPVANPGGTEFQHAEPAQADDDEGIFDAQTPAIRHAESAQDHDDTDPEIRPKTTTQAAPKFNFEELVSRGLPNLPDTELLWLFNNAKRRHQVKERLGGTDDFKAAQKRFTAIKAKRKNESGSEGEVIGVVETENLREAGDSPFGGIEPA